MATKSRRQNSSGEMSSRRQMADTLRQKAADLFALCDKENKGFASKRDMYRLVDELSLTPEQLDEVFDVLDIDQNGCLTLEEFTGGLGMFLGVDCSVFQEEEEDELKQERLIKEMGKKQEDDEEFESLMDLLGAENVFKDEDGVRCLWEKLKQDDPSMLDNFESFLANVAQKVKHTKEENSTLENALKNRSDVHKEQVQTLYTELEYQLQEEKEQLLAEEKMKEQKLRDELESELHTKDQELQDLLMQHAQMEKQLGELNALDYETKYENVKLQKERDVLENRLSSSEQTLKNLQSHLDQLRRRSIEEKRKRAKAALKVSEDIALEREDLVKELIQLKKVNRQLLDEKDEMVLNTSTVAPRSVPLKRKSSSHRSSIPPGHKVLNCEHVEKNGPNLTEEKLTRSHFLNNTLTSDPLMHPLNSIPEPSPYGFTSVSSAQDLTLTDFSKSEEECEVDDNYFLENNPQFLGLNGKERVILQNNLNLDVSEKFAANSTQFKKMTQDDDVNVTQNALNSSNTIANMIHPVDQEISKQKSSSPDRLFKVVFIGDSGVGKTSFIHRYCHNSFRPTFNATVGIDFQVKTINVQDRVLVLQLWDTAGQERFRSITQQYYRKADGIVVVYDVTAEMSFKNVRNWVDHLKENSGENVVIMLIGNKIDLCESEDHRVVKSKHGIRLADEFGTLFYETSAKNGDSVFEAMEGLACLLQDKEDEAIEKVLHLQEALIKRKKKCC